MTGLSQDEAAFFHSQGYLLPERPLLPEGEFSALRDYFDELLQQWTDAGVNPEHMDVPHFYHPELMRWLLHDDVLDVVESLIGPDIALFSSHFICKPAGNGLAVPWHEDSSYWGTAFDPMDVLTIWLAIDPASNDNGNMRVIPGSHTNGYSTYQPVADEQVFSSEIASGQFDEASAVDCRLAAGHYSIHHAKTIHGSAANTSNRRRCGYTMRYVSTHCRWQPHKGRQHVHQLYLARGVDHAGNSYGDPTRINEDFVKQHPIAIQAS